MASQKDGVFFKSLLKILQVFIQFCLNNMNPKGGGHQKSWVSKEVTPGGLAHAASIPCLSTDRI